MTTRANKMPGLLQPNLSRALRLWSSLCIILLMSCSAMGQTTQPTALSETASESQSLRISDSDIRSASAKTSASSALNAGASDLSRIAIALIVVISLILMLRGAYRHLTAMPGNGRALKLVTVLSRSIVSPKQQVLVLQVGNRLLVVGDSNGRMSALCEISDPDEIAMMVGQTRATTSPARPVGTFSSLFRRANEPFAGAESPQTGVSQENLDSDINSDDSTSAEEVGGLLDKVKMLREQFNETKQLTS